MRQVIGPTVGRRLRRAELWNENVEPPLWTVFTDPDHIVLRAWFTHARSRERVVELQRHRSELTVVRLRSHQESAR